MAYNNQQAPFWDFLRSSNHQGAGVDHPATGFPNFGPHGASGNYFYPPGFAESGANFFGPHHRRGRRRHDGNRRGGSHERTPEGSRSGSPNPENPDGDAREASPNAHGHHGSRHGLFHHSRRGGSGGWGGRGGRGGRGGWHGHGHGHGPHGVPLFGGPGGIDLNAFIEAFSAHPIAQAFRTYAEQTAQRSGETFVPETDSEESFVPPIDVFSTEKDYVLHVALPGAKKEDVGVNFDAEKGELNVAGVVYRQGDEEFLKSLTQSERRIGVFERTIKIPPTGQEKEEVDGDAISAKLEDGVLIVTVPKVEKEWTDVKKVDIE